MRVTAEAARRFLVARHFLAPARSLAGGPDAVLEVIRKLGSIQFDPIAVAGRNHDLMLHARIAGYVPAWCDALYDRREIFEATAFIAFRVAFSTVNDALGARPDLALAEAAPAAVRAAVSYGRPIDERATP